MEFKLFNSYAFSGGIFGVELLALDTIESDYALFAVEFKGWRLQYFDLLWLREFTVGLLAWFFG